jgi:hypothetical protein
LNTEKETNLHKKALILVWIGEIWNFFEASIAIWAGLVAGSVALLAFGLDSIIELFAGAVLIWRFWKEKDDKEGKKRENCPKANWSNFFLVSNFYPVQFNVNIIWFF